jgi:hypothetical protein
VNRFSKLRTNKINNKFIKKKQINQKWQFTIFLIKNLPVRRIMLAHLDKIKSCANKSK